LPNIFLIVNQIERGRMLQAELSKQGFVISLATGKEKLAERIIREMPELIILEMDGFSSQSTLHELTHGSKIKTRIPIIVLVSPENLNQPEDYLGADDLVVSPFESRELVFRVRRLLQRNTQPEEVINFKDLVINLANCEVRVNGKVVELTFKEYELLKFLAREPGRVFTREALLNKVWGYDYFGGDRTVDVHIRRLRSKIEESGQVFIETVRNIGYRFKKQK
jgi:two-component system alkaline phosphatase synthesis response regulator PhoP